MVMLQRVNHLSIKQKMAKTPAQPDADNDDNRENVPSLIVEFTIPLKYLSNFGDPLIYL